MALAYHITIHTYGSWLHGAEAGSVDRDHNEFGSAFVAPNADLHDRRKASMKQQPYIMDSPRREVVLQAILEHARYKGWRVWAVHVRTTHVHVVVSADVTPERVMNECKSYASRVLNAAGLDEHDRQRWSRHGSTRHLFDESAVREVIHYVLEGQGVPMAVYRADDL